MTQLVRKLRTLATAFCRDSSGVILPYVTLMLVVIVGTSVLALDGARYMSLQSQLQNGADALALAGAAELDQQSDSITRATNAINNLVTNSTIFGTGDAANVAVSSIQFLSSLPASDATAIGTANVTTDATLATFVRVTVTPVTLNTILPATFFGGTNSVTAGAEATAGFPNTVACNFPPIFICNPYETTGMSDSAATAAFRTAMSTSATLQKQLRLNQNSTGPGQFGFLIPPDGCTGASCLKDWIARTSPKGCYSRGGVSVNTGMKTAVNGGFNVRFDIADSSLSGSPNASYAPATNVRKGWTLKSGKTNWCTDTQAALSPGWTYTTPTYWNNAGACGQNTSSAPSPKAPMALPLDNGFITGTITGIQGDGNWNCDAYWKNNHTASAPAGCTATNPTISRFQVYQYELNNSTVLNEASQYKCTTGAPGCSGTCTTPETGSPQCAVGAGVATPDRRNIVVAVINCLAHPLPSGSTAQNIPVAAFAKYFMTQPVGDDSTNFVYGEFTGYATAKDGVVILDQVQLYR